jgi:OOP family OmpA-OmpF porin
MAHPTPPTPPDDLEVLRRLLLQPEQQALQELRNPAMWEEQVSQALPSALIRRTRTDKSVQYALNPILEETFVRLVRRNPRLLIEILFPILLPTIRRAVASLFASLTQSLNQTLDQAFSVQGLRWRLEALSTGKTFAEVVLSHTLLYRVEQVLLIQRDSGLLLAHQAAPGTSVQDGALVSGMLTAIGDFVRDAFDPGAGLNTVNFGDRVLVVEQSAQAILAAVVRGAPPKELQGRLQDTLSEIHTRFAEELRRYSGDNKIFTDAHPMLEALLETQYKRPESRRPYAVLLMVGVLLVGLGWWGWNNFQTERAWNTYLDRLSNTPGIVVTDAPRRYLVRGLRDPLAASPEGLLDGLPLRPEQLRAIWQPYHSLEPEIVLRRVQQQLGTPSTVQLVWRDGVLVASGSSTWAWLSRLRNLAPLLGVQHLETSQLRLEPQSR